MYGVYVPFHDPLDEISRPLRQLTYNEWDSLPRDHGMDDIFVHLIFWKAFSIFFLFILFSFFRIRSRMLSNKADMFCDLFCMG